MQDGLENEQELVEYCNIPAVDKDTLKFGQKTLPNNIVVSNQSQPTQLTQLEQKAILLLITMSKVSEEIKRRKTCVTIYTWPSAENSSGTSQGRLGHSALKTHRGGSHGTGVYVSFYPGNCDKEIRHPNCKKSVSHFHEWNLDSRSGTTKIDLYGLDVDAINHAFQEMHDGNMNSKKPWGHLYNCSDLVLELLEEGKLYAKIDLNPFSKVRIGIYSLIMSTTGAEFIHLLYTALVINFPSYELSFVNNGTNVIDFDEIGVYSHPLRLVTYYLGINNVKYCLLVNGVGESIIGAFSSWYHTKALTYFNLSRKKLPAKTYNQISSQNSILAAIVGLLPALSITFGPEFLKEYSDFVFKLLPALLGTLYQISSTLFSHKTLFIKNIIEATTFTVLYIVILQRDWLKLRFLQPLDNDNKLQSYINRIPNLLTFYSSYSFMLAIAVGLYQHFYHRITTPNHVLDIIKPIQNKLEKQDNETKQLTNHYSFFRAKKEKAMNNTTTLLPNQEEESFDKSSRIGQESNWKLCTII